MENIRMTVDLAGVPANVVRLAVRKGFSGSMNDVIRNALVVYGERYGLLDDDGELDEGFGRSLQQAAKEKGISTKELKKRLKL
ncbi:hypothetical protein HZC09_03810 [Candidatus Micrarchaeota archaeon]|nr:hypothetical protein [Candidatus Micrarchaeota archaeon]